jgi:hypothetical protein
MSGLHVMWVIDVLVPYCPGLNKIWKAKELFLENATSDF